MSDTEPKDESDDDDDEGILNAFIATVNPTEVIVEEVDEEEDLMKSKFEKMDEQDDIYTAYSSCTRFPRSMRNFIGWPPRS